MSAAESGSEPDEESDEREFLDEARSIRHQRYQNIKNLTDEFDLDYYQDAEESQTAHTEKANEEVKSVANGVLALNVLLKAIVEKPDEGADLNALQSARQKLAQTFSVLSSKVENGVKLYFELLSMCGEGPEDDVDRLTKVFVPRLSKRVRLLFDFELRLYLWFVVLMEAANLAKFEKRFGQKIVDQADLATKIHRKLLKLRQNLGEDELNRIGEELRECKGKLRQCLDKYKQCICEESGSAVDNVDSARVEYGPGQLAAEKMPSESLLERARKIVEKRSKQFAAKRSEMEALIEEAIQTGDFGSLRAQAVEPEEVVPVELDPRRPTRSTSQSSECGERARTEGIIAKTRRKLDDSIRKKQEQRKAAVDEQERQRRLLASLPPLPQEVAGARAVSKEIEKNRGLVRMRKKYSGNARVSNRRKYMNKLKKLSGVKMKAVNADARGGYGGETAGITMHVTRSRKLVS